MNDSTDSELIANPMVRAMLDASRSGELLNPSIAERSGSWSRWALDSIRLHTYSRRSYWAITLPGVVRQPRSQDQEAHVELKAETLISQNHPEWSLAAMGNSALSDVWLFPEIKALRRALNASLSEQKDRSLLEGLQPHHEYLAAEVNRLAALLRDPDHRRPLQTILDTNADELVSVLADITSDEAEGLVGSTMASRLHITHDPKLSADAGGWAPRRIGVWEQKEPGKSGSYAIVTPRFAVASIEQPWYDPTFDSCLSLVARAAVLRRLARLAGDEDQPRLPLPESALRLVARGARPGAATPAANPNAAAELVKRTANGPSAWTIVQTATSADYRGLAVTEREFLDAYVAATSAIATGQAVGQAVADALLPVAWPRDPQRPVARLAVANL